MSPVPRQRMRSTIRSGKSIESHHLSRSTNLFPTLMDSPHIPPNMSIQFRQKFKGNFVGAGASLRHFGKRRAKHPGVATGRSLRRLNKRQEFLCKNETLSIDRPLHVKKKLMKKRKEKKRSLNQCRRAHHGRTPLWPNSVKGGKIICRWCELRDEEKRRESGWRKVRCASSVEGSERS